MGLATPLQSEPPFPLPADPDGLEAGVSDLEQYHAYSELVQLQETRSRNHWDDMCSTTTPCSQTSEEETKTLCPPKAESFGASEKSSYASAMVNLVPGGTEEGQLLTEDSQSYAGMGSLVCPCSV